MRQKILHVRKLWLSICFPALLGGLFFVCSAAVAQTASQPALIDPDQGKMGIYRALAQLAYQDYEKKDDESAAVLVRILERVWDRGEGDLRKSNPAAWRAIDHSMDMFIGPIVLYNPVWPQSEAVDSTYGSLSDKLKPESMRGYRKTADLTYQAFQKGDITSAQTLAGKLWADWRSGESQDLMKSDHNSWLAITVSLRLFVMPMILYQPNRPDPAQEASAYREYLANLKQAD